VVEFLFCRVAKTKIIRRVQLFSTCAIFTASKQANKQTNKQASKQTRGVSHYGLAIYIKKYIKAKEELWKFKYFTMQKYNLQRIL